MKIYIYNPKHEAYVVEIDEADYVKDVKRKITHKIRITSEFELIFNGMILEDDEPISSYHIHKGVTMEYLELFKSGSCIDNIKEEIDLKMEIDTRFLSRDELYINLIHFDLSMTNSENYYYLNNFKIDVVGGFHAIDNLDILKRYLEKIKEKNIPFIVITSGTSGKDVIPLCKKYSFIKEVIIFCKNYNYNEHYIQEYPGYVKHIFTCIALLYEYIKTFGEEKYKDGIEKYKFSRDEIKMENQIQQCPVISAKEYDECYFLIHKAYSDFFGDINNINEKPQFDNNNLNKIKECLNKIKGIGQNKKTKLIAKFNDLINIKDNNSFVEKCISYYTKEDIFCYLFNRIMRGFEPRINFICLLYGAFSLWNK